MAGEGRDADHETSGYGIRTRAKWMPEVEEALTSAGLLVEKTSYGKFGLLNFLLPFPFLKKAASERLRADVKEAIRRHKTDNEPVTVSVIAHSFGTLALLRFLERHRELQFNKLILCGSVAPEDYPFSSEDKNYVSILNEVGSKDCWPAIAEKITWGYGAIGTHGANRPGVINRWHTGLRHSDFLNRKFAEKWWVPFLCDDRIVAGDRPTTSICGTIVDFLPLKWVILSFLLIAAFIITFFGEYLYVPASEPRVNVVACKPYHSSTAENWRETNLLPDSSETYYVIVHSELRAREYPALNRLYAELEASRIRRSFPKVDVDVMDTANPAGGNRMHAIVLARGVSSFASACKIVRMANRCGISEVPAYAYRLHEGVENCGGG